MSGVLRLEISKVAGERAGSQTPMRDSLRKRPATFSNDRSRKGTAKTGSTVLYWKSASVGARDTQPGAENGVQSKEEVRTAPAAGQFARSARRAHPTSIQFFSGARPLLHG